MVPSKSGCIMKFKGQGPSMVCKIGYLNTYTIWIHKECSVTKWCMYNYKYNLNKTTTYGTKSAGCQNTKLLSLLVFGVCIMCEICMEMRCLPQASGNKCMQVFLINRNFLVKYFYDAESGTMWPKTYVQQNVTCNKRKVHIWSNTWISEMTQHIRQIPHVMCKCTCYIYIRTNCRCRRWRKSTVNI